MKFSDAARLPRFGPWPKSGQPGFFYPTLRLLLESKLSKIEKLKKLYEQGGKQTFGPNLPNQLSQHYFMLYLHVNSNYIVYDVFKRYKALTEKVFKGLILSYHIPEHGIESFNDFFLTEAILHISPDSLQEILKNETKLEIINGGVVKMLEKLNNFTTSFFVNGLFSETYENSLILEQLSNYNFKRKCVNIFTNLFTIFSRLDIEKDEFNICINLILKFLKIEKILSWVSINEFAYFIIKKGSLFEEKDLLEILKISINGTNYGCAKYIKLFEAIPNAFMNFYPDYKIDNVKLIQVAILNCSSESGRNVNYMHLVYLANICNDNCKDVLFSAFESYLDQEFDNQFYQSLIRDSDYSYNLKDYFQLYSENTNLSKGGRAYKYGNFQLTDLVFINYAWVLYKLNIDFNRQELKVFTDLNDFETWLLNPIDFDYNRFEPSWLKDVNDSIFLERLKGNLNIENAIELQLGKKFDPVIAEIKYKYFNTSANPNE